MREADSYALPFLKSYMKPESGVYSPRTKVALLLDNGSLVPMDSDKGTQTILDAAADNLPDLLYKHKNLLYQLS